MDGWIIASVLEVDGRFVKVECPLVSNTDPVLFSVGL